MSHNGCVGILIADYACIIRDANPVNTSGLPPKGVHAISQFLLFITGLANCPFLFALRDLNYYHLYLKHKIQPLEHITVKNILNFIHFFYFDMLCDYLARSFRKGHCYCYLSTITYIFTCLCYAYIVYNKFIIMIDIRIKSLYLRHFVYKILICDARIKINVEIAKQKYDSKLKSIGDIEDKSGFCLLLYWFVQSDI